MRRVQTTYFPTSYGEPSAPRHSPSVHLRGHRGMTAKESGKQFFRCHPDGYGEWLDKGVFMSYICSRRNVFIPFRPWTSNASSAPPYAGGGKNNAHGKKTPPPRSGRAEGAHALRQPVEGGGTSMPQLTFPVVRHLTNTFFLPIIYRPCGRPSAAWAGCTFPRTFTPLRV